MPARSPKAAPARALRAALDALYAFSAYAGAAFVLGIGLLIASQVIGREFGQQVKGADDLTAWSVVAAAFLPLAYTYRTNGQIRVTLVIERLTGARRRILERIVLALALFLVGFLCYSGFDMAWDSFRFDDHSNGLIVIPLWIPQISIGIGTLIFLIALLDDLAASLAGREPSYQRAAEAASDADPASPGAN